jgi:hypothetical protein
MPLPRDRADAPAHVLLLIWCVCADVMRPARLAPILQLGACLTPGASADGGFAAAAAAGYSDSRAAPATARRLLGVASGIDLGAAGAAAGGATAAPAAAPATRLPLAAVAASQYLPPAFVSREAEIEELAAEVAALQARLRSHNAAAAAGRDVAAGAAAAAAAVDAAIGVAGGGFAAAVGAAEIV